MHSTIAQKKHRLLGKLLLIFLFLPLAQAKAYSIDSYSASVGFGMPNALIGGRLALQKNWPWEWTFADDHLILTGYWDFSTAYWQTNGKDGTNHQIFIFAVAPVVRLESAKAILKESIYPYIELGVGPSYATATSLSRRNLGSHFNFQNFMGAGIRFGSHKQYDVSYHYIHYSNANFFPPNNGIDVKELIMFRYFFS